jgi:hypothetical protein
VRKKICIPHDPFGGASNPGLFKALWRRGAFDILFKLSKLKIQEKRKFKLNPEGTQSYEP